MRYSKSSLVEFYQQNAKIKLNPRYGTARIPTELFDIPQDSFCINIVISPKYRLCTPAWQIMI